MNPSTRLEKYQKRNRGIALVIVISIVAMLTVLTVAMITISDNERRSSVKYADGENASNLVDSAVSLVMKQIWDGSDQTGSKIYATQPGAVRRYTSSGAFESGYKLYSSEAMVVTTTGVNGEKMMANDTPDLQWQTKPGQWVDLNEPAIRPDSAHPEDASFNTTLFPILDPRAVIIPAGSNGPNAGDSASVEGFTYNAAAMNGVVAASQIDGRADADNICKARLPMPVKWLYMLKDGTLGTMDSGGGGGGDVYTWVGTSGGTTPSKDNPIVGRIAFWADDESCKLNINTAGEPTPWAPPSVNYDLDMQWVASPPTRHEYQRYPGHPATVALSTVLMPNQAYDLYGFPMLGSNSFTVPVTAADIKKRRERLYAILPKIAGAGSNEGTVPFWTMGGTGFGIGTAGAANNVDIANSLKKHLYASVDELLFSEAVDSYGKRYYQDDSSQTGGDTVKNLFPLKSFPSVNVGPKTAVGGMQPSMYLDRLRGFLTASSRAPEMTLFGTPRVALWPIADQKIVQVRGGGSITDYRTAFDNAIAYCASLGKPNASGQGKDTYYFTRADSTSATYDIDLITRNQILLKYLHNLMARDFPTGGAKSGSGASFVNKYNGGDAEQILTEVFDYIRCTNLCDGMLAAPKATLLANASYNITGKNDTQVFQMRDKLASSVRTYTMDRASNTYTDDHDKLNGGASQLLADDGFPGSGQVVPIQIDPVKVFGAAAPSGQTALRGFGRFPTVTEVGMLFICTADGANDRGSWHGYGTPSGKLWNLDGVISGGRTVTKIDDHIVDVKNNTSNTTGFTSTSGDLVLAFLETNAVKGATYKIQRYAHWYSNFPPLTNPNAGVPKYGTTTGGAGVKDPNNHPGHKPANWNYSLKSDTPLNGTPGQAERQVQGMICLEPTVIAAGWTGIYADFSLVVTGYDQLQLNGQPLFSHVDILKNGKKGAIWRSNRSAFNGWGCRVAGGSISPFNTADGRSARIYQPGNGGKKFVDGGYDLTNPSKTNYAASTNFDLITDFVTIGTEGPTNKGGKGMMTLSNLAGNTPITIEIYAGHEPDLFNGKPVQTIQVDFANPNLILPIPQLVTVSYAHRVSEDTRTGNKSFADRVEAPSYWSLNRDGILGRSIGAATGRFRHLYGRDTLFWGWGGGAHVMNDYGDAVDSFSDPYSNAESLRDRVFQGAGNNRSSIYNPGAQRPFGQDVVISMVPVSGDFRRIAAMKVVGPAEWKLHPAQANGLAVVLPKDSPKMPQLAPADDTAPPSGAPKTLIKANYPEPSYLAHSFSRYNNGGDAGFNNGEDNAKNNAKDRFATGAYYAGEVLPELPAYKPSVVSPTPVSYVKNTGDFDTGLANLRDGAWINRPDEGNTSTQYYNPSPADPSSISRQWLTSYFDVGYHGSPGGENYMTPNRMISSAGMLGSLPTKIWGGAEPWRTLLFRPHIRYTTRIKDNSMPVRHPGEPTYVQQTIGTAKDPGDHYLMDLFWMPVIEPYAISEPLSSAGKINMNYQMVPFNKYIRRATGMHAVLKGEIMGAFPTQDAGYYKGDEVSYNPDNSTYQGKVTYPGTTVYYNRKHAPNDTDKRPRNKFWYRPIEPDAGIVGSVKGTLGQFDDRFEFGANNSGNIPATPAGTYGLFRTASQICEIHLLPRKIKAGQSGTPPDATLAALDTKTPAEGVQDGSDKNPGSPYYKVKDMADFWDDRAITGDNIRERPYANIYAKVTTQSNTFRVHYRVQTIRKARSMDADKFDPTQDSVTSEYRGSTLIERRIDPSVIPFDYATASSAQMISQPLSKFYSFRVLENKRFMP